MSVFVTVGTTSFDELVKVVTSDPIVQILQSRAYHKLVVQYGRGACANENVKSANFTIEAFRYKWSISDDISSADLVISHAGAGTCLEVLAAAKPLVVVVNEKLMNNHQFELAKQFYNDGHLLYCTCSTLADTLANMDLSALKPLPPPKTFKFSENLASHFGVN